MGDTEVEGATREGSPASGGEGEEEALCCKFYSTVLYGKVHSPSVCKQTWKGENVSSKMMFVLIPGDQSQVPP